MARRRTRGPLAALAAVAASYATVKLGKAEVVDAPLRRALRSGGQRAGDLAVGVVTDLGSVYALTGICAVLAARRRVRPALEVAVAGGIAWSAAQAAKPLLDRHRPYELGEARRLVAEPAGTSWPSGHAALITAMADTLAPSLTRGGRLTVGATAVGVGLSRCYVGVHHATDVVAGMGVGMLSSRAASWLIDTLTASVTRRGSTLRKRSTAVFGR